MVEGAGFEPAKAEPSDLQSDPFGRSGTPPHYFVTFGPTQLSGKKSGGGSWIRTSEG